MNLTRILCAAVAALVLGGSLLPANGADKLRVFVPVLPYEYLFERIGGDRIEVSAIVQEGGDCHNYSPSPRQTQTGTVRCAKSSNCFVSWTFVDR